MEFEAFPPEEIDFQGVKKLLKQLFLKENVDVSGLTDLLIKKNTNYSLVIKQESEEENEEEERDNDEEVYAITSLVGLNGNELNEEKPIQNVKEYFLAKTEKSPEFSKFLKSKSNLYWLINERFINLSPKLSLPSFEAILKEISNDKLTIDNVIMVIKVLKCEEKCQNPKTKKIKGENDIIYQNPEEELLDENASHSIEFSVANQCDEDARWDDEDTKYVPYRKILLFTKKSFDKALDCLRKELGE